MSEPKLGSRRRLRQRKSTRMGGCVSSESGYHHKFHAGNVGDVWKHLVLIEWLRGLRGKSPLHVVDTHAGAGRYGLGPTGEWTEGVGKLWTQVPNVPEDRVPAIVRGYLEHVPAGKRAYPGSPALIAEFLGEGDHGHFFEIEPAAHAQLTENLGGKSHLHIHNTDGLAGLLERVREVPKDHTLAVHIDPPWVEKEDWQAIPDVLLEAWRLRPTTQFLLWYPVKSHTRPNAVLQRLGKSGMPGTALELITTPLELQKNRLNGSGVLLVNVDDSVHMQALAATPLLGRLCSTHAGRYATRTISWTGAWEGRPL